MPTLDGHTGCVRSYAIQSDQMIRKPKSFAWETRPFTESLHCIDAPEYIPTPNHTNGAGVLWQHYEKRS